MQKRSVGKQISGEIRSIAVEDGTTTPRGKCDYCQRRRRELRTVRLVGYEGDGALGRFCPPCGCRITKAIRKAMRQALEQRRPIIVGHA